VDPLVEQLKKSSEADAKRRDTESAIRLHNAAIIEAKTPAFWSLVKERVTAICAELRQELPNDNRYHLSVEPQFNGFFLHGGKLPRCILSAQLNVTAQRVDLSERIKHALEDQPWPELKSPITITVGPDEQLIFRFESDSFDTPERLARALVTYVGRFSRITVSCSEVR
jgi:hypothetical protein